jgi:hypothetical protein
MPFLAHLRGHFEGGRPCNGEGEQNGAPDDDDKNGRQPFGIAAVTAHPIIPQYFKAKGTEASDVSEKTRNQTSLPHLPHGLF